MKSRAKRTVGLIADAVLGRLAPLLIRPGPATLPSAPRVLVIRCDHIGDAAMATAVLRPLRNALHAATLDVLAGPWAAAVFEGNASVDRVLTYATPWWSAARGAPLRERIAGLCALPAFIRTLRAEHYDIGIDLRGDLRQIACFLVAGGMPIRVSSDRTGGRRLLTHVWRHDPSLHEVEKNFAIASLVGATGAASLEIGTAKNNASAVDRRMLSDELPSGAYAVFALQGSAPNRSWPVRHAAAVIDRLFSEFELGSVYVGGAADAAFGAELSKAARSPVVNLAGRTTLAESLEILRGAAVTIAVDSGPMHLAAAVGSPVVALFGPGNPRDCRPWSPTAHVVSAGAPCGCVGRTCAFAVGPGRCMSAIEPEQVLDAIRLVPELADAHKD